ncbi:DUF4006 family protein [Sulfurimonas paralvinellae]|uniref:DUF4006 family protein n=1 Tax=Sulfurimonas paralvinellae TaxID=317658 RepID=A0A7M1B9X9_9BACT|nr:DUF4006 family protein [Sulfurimonas paralvinellae]QOP46504.1 DUF4006 family protein [Sulfurimonas paralvinellae]
MNENRSVFALDGVTGMLIATVLLLSILAFLSVNAVSVQHAQAENFYKIKDEKSIKRIDTESYKHVVDVK